MYRLSEHLDKSRRYVEAIDLFAAPINVHLEAVQVSLPERWPMVIVLRIPPAYSMCKLMRQNERREVWTQIPIDGYHVL
jgi:hypothetical protein